MAARSERVALVTGGGRGIGRSVVLALVRRGFRVAFCYRSDTAAAEACVQTATETDGDVFAVQADVTLEADRTRLVDTVRDRMGAIDVLVNNAGTTEDGVAFRMKEAWDRVVDLDLTAPFRLAQLVIRGMMSNGWGRIVTIGSIASRLGFPGQANYTAAKAGVEGMTRSLAQEYGRRGVTVNTVSPGFIETDLTRDASDLARTYVENYSALGRFVTADAVAEVVAFIVSDQAWAVTGQTINVDGGLVKL
ncbi:MAG: 3-oxoacyl-ACP reductase FabG [Spirochaetaceae bacterium]|nr:MAG: 3-oxoacyl-ACP reductase FabG [Spirochaetaceae bacterium]